MEEIGNKDQEEVDDASETKILQATGCSEETGNYKFVTALVVYHLESYGISAFFTDNGTF